MVVSEVDMMVHGFDMVVLDMVVLEFEIVVVQGGVVMLHIGDVSFQHPMFL